MTARPEYPDLELDAQLCFPLYAAARAVTSEYASLLAEVGLTYPQYVTMLALWSEAPSTVGRLGDRLRLDSGTLTPLLKRLETAGFVHRRRDPSDERRVLVEPTDEGWALREAVKDVPARLGERLQISVRDADALRGLLGQLLPVLDASRTVERQRGHL